MNHLNAQICKNLQTLEAGNWKPLLTAYADASVRAFDPIDYWRQIPAEVSRVLSKEQLSVMQGRFNESDILEQVNKGDYQVISDLSDKLLRNCLLCKTEGDSELYTIVDRDQLKVSFLASRNYNSTLTRIVIDEWRSLFGEVMATPLARKLADSWFHNATLNPMPAAMARDNKRVWCLHRPEVTADASVAFPAWDKITKRMSDPEAFAAWIGGIYTGKYKGRMMLWLYGPNGEDGKSTIARVIGKTLFGPAFAAISDSTLKSERRFLNSYFAGAELICYGDASNTKILGMEEFKTLASHGSDVVLIERKHKQPYFSELTARVWVNSNYLPEIENTNFAASRLLLIHIEKMADESPNPNVGDHLKQQLPGFLAYAIDCYDRLCEDNYKIQLNSATNNLIKSCMNQQEHNYGEIFDKNWEYSENESDKIESSVISRVLREEGILATKDQAKFYEWAEKNRQISKRKVSSLGGKTFIFSIKRNNGSSIDINALLEFDN
jgi:hypothetical protein